MKSVLALEHGKNTEAYLAFVEKHAEGRKLFWASAHVSANNPRKIRGVDRVLVPKGAPAGIEISIKKAAGETVDVVRETDVAEEEAKAPSGSKVKSTKNS